MWTLNTDWMLLQSVVIELIVTNIVIRLSYIKLHIFLTVTVTYPFLRETSPPEPFTGNRQILWIQSEADDVYGFPRYSWEILQESQEIYMKAHKFHGKQISVMQFSYHVQFENWVVLY